MTKKAILVLGMHRSGTSALTGALAQLGVVMPKTEMEATAENPKGYFESHAIMSVNDNILASCKSTWDDWRSFPLERVSSDAEKQIEAVLLEEYGDADFIAIKDPRICKIADLWLPVLARLGLHSSIIIPYRHPAEVAKSLGARQMSETRALLLWLRHVLDAEAKTRGLRRVFVYTPDLLTNWRDSLTSTGRALGVKWPRSLTRASDDIEAFLDKNLVHHSAGLDVFDSHDIFGGWIRTAFLALEGMKHDSQSSQQQLILDGVREAFDNAGRLFGPSLAEVNAELNKATALLGVERERGASEAAAREARIGQMANEKDVLASHNRDLHYENVYLREAVSEKEKAALQMVESHALEITRLTALYEAEMHRAQAQSAEQARAVALLSEELSQTRTTWHNQVDALRKIHITEISRMEGEAASTAAANKAFVEAIQAEREALQHAQAEVVGHHEQITSSLTTRCESLAAEVEHLKAKYVREMKEQAAAAEARLSDERRSSEAEKVAFNAALSQMRSEHDAQVAVIAEIQRIHAGERLADREQWTTIHDRQNEELAALRQVLDKKRGLEFDLAQLSARVAKLEAENAQLSDTVTAYRKAKAGDFLKWAAQPASRP